MSGIVKDTGMQKDEREMFSSRGNYTPTGTQRFK